MTADTAESELEELEELVSMLGGPNKPSSERIEEAITRAVEAGIHEELVDLLGKRGIVSGKVLEGMRDLAKALSGDGDPIELSRRGVSGALGGLPPRNRVAALRDYLEDAGVPTLMKLVRKVGALQANTTQAFGWMHEQGVMDEELVEAAEAAWKEANKVCTEVAELIDQFLYVARDILEEYLGKRPKTKDEPTDKDLEALNGEVELASLLLAGLRRALQALKDDLEVGKEDIG